MTPEHKPHLMPCGHPESAVVSSGEGTAHCGECAEGSQHNTQEKGESHGGRSSAGQTEVAKAVTNQHPTPRADVLAEEYKGTYLWAELDKAQARIADLEEQFEALRFAAIKAAAQLPEDPGRAMRTLGEALDSFPATVFDTPEATLYEDGVLRIQESTPAKGHPMLGVSEMHSDAHSPASGPKEDAGWVLDAVAEGRDPLKEWSERQRGEHNQESSQP